MKGGQLLYWHRYGKITYHQLQCADSQHWRATEAVGRAGKWNGDALKATICPQMVSGHIAQHPTPPVITKKPQFHLAYSFFSINAHSQVCVHIMQPAQCAATSGATQARLSSRAENGNNQKKNQFTITIKITNKKNDHRTS